VNAWDAELEVIANRTRHMVTHHKATVVIAVAVDDERKRDYFVPRLQKILDEQTWARYVTFRVVPMVGQYVELRAKGDSA
jgi:hypothetical protein